MKALIFFAAGFFTLLPAHMTFEQQSQPRSTADLYMSSFTEAMQQNRPYDLNASEIRAKEIRDRYAEYNPDHQWIKSLDERNEKIQLRPAM